MLLKNCRKGTNQSRIRFEIIVHELVKMLHETIVDYYVKFVNYPSCKVKAGWLALLCPYVHRVFAKLLLKTSGEVARCAEAYLVGNLVDGLSGGLQ